MNGNGHKIDMWKILTALIVPVMFFIGSNVIANDKASRDRDERIKDAQIKICNELKAEQVAVQREQFLINQQILIALQDIKTEQRVTKELIKSGRTN